MANRCEPRVDTNWLAVELRAGLARCPCVRSPDGRHYARRGCPACHGAGVLPAPEYRATSCDRCEAVHLTTDPRNSPSHDGWVMEDDDNDTGTLCPSCLAAWREVA